MMPETNDPGLEPTTHSDAPESATAPEAQADPAVVAGDGEFGTTLLDDPVAEPSATVTEPEPTPEPEPMEMNDPTEPTVTEPVTEPTITEPSPVVEITLDAPELSVDALEKVTTVLVQTGASRASAQRLLTKMDNREKQMLDQSIEIVDGQLRIADSAMYFAAFENFSDRVYKASVET